MKYILFFILFISSSSFAQVSINSSGGNISNTTGSASFSIGQLIVTNANNSNLISIQQGVQFPYETFGLGINSTSLLPSFIKIYPNPTSSILNIDIENNNLFDLVLEVYDSQSKCLLLEKIYPLKNAFDLSALSPGLYCSIIRNNAGFLYTQKIIKY
jgi:hypothetical protein